MPLTTTSTAGVAHKRGVPVVAPSSAAAGGQEPSAPPDHRKNSSRTPLKRRRAEKAASSSVSRSGSSSSGRRGRQGRGDARGHRRASSGPSGAGHLRAAAQDRKGYDCYSPLRGRSRTPGGLRDGHYQKRPVLKECWYGRYCTRVDCYFLHPDGRKLDEKYERYTEENKKKHDRRERKQKRRQRRKSASPAPVSSSRSPSASRPASPAKRGSRARSSPAPSKSASSRASSAKSSSAKSSRKSSRSASARSAKSQRSSSKASERKAEGGDGAVKKEESESEGASFKAFVLRELDDSATPEDALAKFEEHKRGLLRKQAEGLKGTGAFYDLYHPLSLQRRFDLRTRTAQLMAQAFLQDVQKGRFEDLSLRATTTGSPTCPTTGHMQPPHFAFDPDTDAVLVEGISPAVSAWTLYDALAAAPGLAAAWAKPASMSAARELRVRFASADSANAALAALEEASLESDQKPRVRLLEPVADLHALVVPPEMSNPGRVEKDLELSAKILRRLDALLGVPAETTEALLQREGPSCKKLDLQVLYLRRVHHFCFYAASWCDDEWDLRKQCGAALVRDGEAEAPAEEGDWSKAHEERLRGFLATVEFPRPTALQGCSERFAERASALCREKTQQATETKFRCLVDNKYFKGPEYAHKHLRKAHPALFEPLMQEAYDEAAVAAFCAAPIPSGDGGR